jgi:hypothetical protein
MFHHSNATMSRANAVLRQSAQSDCERQSIMGLTVSRLQRYGHTDTLEPENRKYESVVLDSKHKRKIFAKVLCWIGKAR